MKIGGIVMQTSLDRVCMDEEVTVTQMKLGKGLENRLRDFGMIPGTAVYCRYCSPGGQVTAVECRGAVIAIRTRDLRGIGVRY